jgi:heptosyltransferase-1
MDHAGPSKMNILIVKLSAIGDVVHTLPALAALRKLYPQAFITWVIEEGAADLIQDHPYLDKVLVSHRKRWLRDLKKGRLSTVGEILQFIKELRSRRYDLVIDFHGLLKSSLIVLLTSAERKIGYDSMQELSGLFVREKVPEDMDKHAVDRYLDLVRYLDKKELVLPGGGSCKCGICYSCSRGSGAADNATAGVKRLDRTVCGSQSGSFVADEALG